MWVGASQRSKGRRYADATSWKLASPIPSEVGNLQVEAATPGNAPRLVFSALDASVAGDIEEAFAEADHLVVSNARNHRMTPNVPLLIPEVNPDHLSLLESQRAQGRTGAIVTNPNCSTVTLVMALAPLKEFGIQKVLVTTSQAVSGAGYPGTPSLDILGNIIPFIGGEEVHRTRPQYNPWCRRCRHSERRTYGGHRSVGLTLTRSTHPQLYETRPRPRPVLPTMSN